MPTGGTAGDAMVIGYRLAEGPATGVELAAAIGHLTRLQWDRLPQPGRDHLHGRVRQAINFGGLAPTGRGLPIAEQKDGKEITYFVTEYPTSPGCSTALPHATLLLSRSYARRAFLALLNSDTAAAKTALAPINNRATLQDIFYAAKLLSALCREQW